MTRPGEFSSSSVKNIKNVILFESGSAEEEEGGQDGVHLENLDRFDLIEGTGEVGKKEKREGDGEGEGEGEEWVTATLSEPNNK